MNTSAENVRFDESTLWVDLQDGRSLGVPLAWFPRLLNATPEQRSACRISRYGLHWDGIDEDILVDDLLAGYGDISRRKTPAREPLAA